MATNHRRRTAIPDHLPDSDGQFLPGLDRQGFQSVPGEGSKFSVSVATGSLDGVAMLDDPNRSDASDPPSEV